MRKLAVCSSAALVLAGAPRLAGQSTPQNPPGQPVGELQGVRAIPSNIIQNVIVKVNGEILTQTELEQRQTEAVRQENQDPKDVKSLQDDAKLAAKLSEITPAHSGGGRRRALIVQRGRELGIKFTDENFKSALDNVKKQNKPGRRRAEAGAGAGGPDAGAAPAELRTDVPHASRAAGNHAGHDADGGGGAAVLPRPSEEFMKPADA